MKVTLNIVAVACVVVGGAVLGVAIGTDANDTQLAAASGFALLLGNTAGTIAGRTKGQS